jgi:hypothetical protein
MSYATVEELATALRVRLTPENEDGLQACLDAAAAEIDHDVDWRPEVDPRIEGNGLPYPEGDARLALLGRVNLLRGVEWWKSNDAAFGLIGYSEITGALQTPRDGFSRHATALSPCKQRWGLA